MDIKAAMDAGITALENWKIKNPQSVKAALQNLAAVLWEKRADLPPELVKKGTEFTQLLKPFLADSYFSRSEIGEALETLANSFHLASDPWLAPLGRVQHQVVSITITGLQQLRRQHVG